MGWNGGMEMLFLETDRLQLRNFVPGDLAVLFEYRNCEVCARYQRWDDTSMQSLDEFIKRVELDVFPSRKDEQHYAIGDHDDHLVGDLSVFFNEQDPCITLGITIDSRYQRCGYAREMLAAVIGCLEESYPGVELVALIDPENLASVGLFRSLGFIEECYAEKIHSLVYVRKNG